MHETIIELLKCHFRVTQHVEPDQANGSILDAGSGTGAESIRVMKEFPNLAVVAIDLCKPMHREFHKNLKAVFGPSFSINSSQRWVLIEGDILGREGSQDSLRDFLPVNEQGTGYKAVITTFTIHHLKAAEKRQAYRQFYDVLEQGGVMINGDLFTYQSPDLRAFANDFDVRWIMRQFENPEPQFKEAASIRKAKRRELSKLWLRHYKRDNILDAIEGGKEGGNSSSAEPNLRGQAGMLRDIGFRQVGNPFRFWQVGILWARK